MADNELDVRQLRKPDKHPTIFARYTGLLVGESFVLVNNHDPKHLHDEFEADLAGSYSWEYLENGPAIWRIRITKLTATPFPRILINTADAASAPFRVRCCGCPSTRGGSSPPARRACGT